MNDKNLNTFEQKEIDELVYKYDMMDKSKSINEKITLTLLHQARANLEKENLKKELKEYNIKTYK